MVSQSALFQEGLQNGAIKKMDGFYSFNLYIGQYGGFMGLFSKENYKPHYILVDDELLKLVPNLSRKI